METEKRFCTIIEAGKLPWTPRTWALRVMKSRGELPGFQRGNRYYVDTKLLREMIDAGKLASV